MFCNTVGTGARLKADKACIAIQKNCIVTGQGGKAGLYCNTTQLAQDTASQRAALGLRYGAAGAQPAPTTQPLGPRYDRRGAREGAG